MNVVLKTAGDPAALAEPLRRRSKEIDPGIAVAEHRDDGRDRGRSPTAASRFYATLVAIFAGLALVLAAVGIYGVMSYAVTQRTQEIGVRLALGAGRTADLRAVVGESLRLAAVGLAFGLAGAIALGRAMRHAAVRRRPGHRPVVTFAASTAAVLTVVASWPATCRRGAPCASTPWRPEVDTNRPGARLTNNHMSFFSRSTQPRRAAGRRPRNRGAGAQRAHRAPQHREVLRARHQPQLRPAPHQRSTSRKASSSRSWGRRAPASRRCCTSSACTTAPGRASTTSSISRCTGSARRSAPKLHKQHIGFVFQSYHLLDHLTVYENLDIPLSYRDIKKSERESMVCDILDKFAIVGKKDLYPNQLSGGQQQLVAVARAVISNPKVILADEPTGNLHSSQGKEIMELFKKLNEGGHDDHPGHALGDERRLRQPHHPPARRLDRGRMSRICETPRSAERARGRRHDGRPFLYRRLLTSALRQAYQRGSFLRPPPKSPSSIATAAATAAAAAAATRRHHRRRSRLQASAGPR